MTAILLLALSSLFVFAAGWHLECKAHRRTQQAHRRTYAALLESEEYRDAVKRSALAGAPAVKWHRDLAEGLPNGADMWYWRIRVSGGDLLLTEEQMAVARKRADALLNHADTNQPTSLGTASGS